MLYIIYDFIFIFGLILYLPIYFWRGKVTFFALKQKFGIIPQVNGKEAVWIQVVSVGEVNLIEGLVKRIKEVYACPIVISTTTLTGNKVAKEKYSSLAKIIFFPFDLSLVLRRVLGKIKPKIFIAVETEIWPNLYRHLSEKNVPIVIINGRISDKAFKRYKLVRGFMGGVLNKCAYIGVQNEAYRDRFIFLGADEGRVTISGNIKFSGLEAKKQIEAQAKEKYASALKKGNALLLVAASTHPPEEEIIVKIYKDILKVDENVTLLIAPRHPERTAAVEKIIFSAGFNPLRMSGALSSSAEKKGVYISDTIGRLAMFYSIADICFVGGSLAARGGQNILEPLCFSKPTVFGPNMDNFADVERAALEKKAAIKVKDEDELKQALLELVRNKDLRADLSGRCLDVFENGKKSLENNFQLVAKCLPR